MALSHGSVTKPILYCISYQFTPSNQCNFASTLCAHAAGACPRARSRTARHSSGTSRATGPNTARAAFETLTLHSGNPAEQKALPDLYEPVLVGLAPNTYVLRRYERVDTSEGGIGVVQEWHCRDL